MEKLSHATESILDENVERLAAAAEHEADVASIIRIKGYGCLGGTCESEAGWI